MWRVGSGYEGKWSTCAWNMTLVANLVLNYNMLKTELLITL